MGGQNGPQADADVQRHPRHSARESVCCLLVLNSVTFTPQWIRQPEAAWGVCVVCVFGACV
jgi:hypothetical protein